MTIDDLLSLQKETGATMLGISDEQFRQLQKDPSFAKFAHNVVEHKRPSKLAASQNHIAYTFMLYSADVDEAPLAINVIQRPAFDEVSLASDYSRKNFAAKEAKGAREVKEQDDAD